MPQRFTQIVSLLLLLGGPVSADELPPIEDTSSELADALRDLERNPRGPDAELRVLALADHWDTAGPEAVFDTLERATEIPRLAPAARERLRLLTAIAHLKTGDPDAAQADFDARGFVSSWQVIGPFDNEGGTGFHTPYGPETPGCAEIERGEPHDGLPGPVRWRAVPTAAATFGELRLDALTEPDEGVCFYALSSLEAERAGEAALRIGAAGAVKVIWNGRVALENEAAFREADPDRQAAAVVVRKGTNRLLVKVCSDETGRLGLFARITDRAYSPWPIAASTETSTVPACARARRDEARPRPLASPLEQLLRRAETRAATADDQATASDYLARTGALHQASHQARDLARSACERTGSADHCLLWADLALDRNERREAIENTLEARPDSPAALLALAEVESEGPDPDRARRLLERVLASGESALEARLLAVEIDAALGLSQTALERADTIAEQLPGVPAPTLLARDLAQSAGAIARAMELTEAVLGFHFDDLESHETLARAAAARGDRAAFELHREAIMVFAGDDAIALRELSGLLEGLGCIEAAEDLLAAAVELAPYDPGAHKSLGRFLLRTGHRDRGLAALTLARSISPQDAWLADYLELLDPAPRYQQPFVVPAEEFLAARGSFGADEDARYLVDCQVARVFESGLSSHFTQLVVEVGSRAAAREWRQHGIQYSPDSQRFKLLAARVFKKDGSIEQSTGRGTVPISEPWYRLYYDVSAEIVEFPPLEPGDVVELQYRVDDTAVRNAFSDYFGELVLVHDSIAKDLWRYALVVPAAREVVYAEPAIENLVRRSDRDGDTVVEVFEARGVEPVHREQRMPGDTAGSAYLHLSTYDSWEALGEWYRGLIRNQLLPDAEITDVVREVTAGLRDDRSKVSAIYGWVVTATRYVGLEFGIHGYKPYRAPLVASRGFGDCKDKASLLVTMLREAGIEAELALVRTRSAGAIEQLPASLSVFNHAIAYVPSLDLWLDGTAEHHGTAELPFEDQGVVALRMTADGAAIGKTPIMGAETSLFDERLQVLLDADGEANLTVRTRVSGDGAPLLRSELEAERTRRERFEGSLVERYPGARLGELEFDDLSLLEQPVRFEFTAFVPGFGRAVGQEIDLPVDGGLDLAKRYCKLSRREHDLVTGPRRTTRRTVRIALPVGFRPSKMPSAAVIESRFGELELALSVAGDEIRIEREFALTAAEVTSDEYADFCAFAREVDEALKARITLSRKP